ncbi:MAG: DGQHR domain-containing protein [Ferrovibrio sp.]|uniref:DGQHR domain-containing protein n=1 Tax=Ferrovibrio sp. TaxID=1917215 RepID=UPI00391B70E2
MRKKSITFKAIKVRQPIGEFFIGALNSKDLHAISYADVRRIEKERDVEKYLGIQRPLNLARVKEIKEYVKTSDATFPTAIILAVDGSVATWDERNGTMTLTEYTDERRPSRSVPFEQIAKILDGQHRVEGLSEYKGDDFELNVTIFIDADIAEQANIFATVNLAQTKVNKSLVYDLYDLAKARSPQKSCHFIAVGLDQQQKSPFFGRIKRLGVATEGRFNETLTQATVVEAIMRYITRRPMQDRDKLMRGTSLLRASGEDEEKLIFRNLFIDEKDSEIAKIIWTYFSAVRSRWPTAWDNFERGNILVKTNGFRAFMRFLRPAYLHVIENAKISESAFIDILSEVKLKDRDFNTLEFPPGSSGESLLVERLRMETGL